jgi:hypothetical protein
MWLLLINYLSDFLFGGNIRMANETRVLPSTRLGSGSTKRLDSTLNLFRIEWTDSPNGDPKKIIAIRDLINDKMGILLRHRYFWACRSGSLSREKLLEIMKQFYCFSILYERLLTRRISGYSSNMNRDLLRVAREHMKKEVGRVDLFAQSLLDNGIPPEELQNIVPGTFTRAIFGYLMTTLEYENEFVSNIAIIQVMETIGMYFFEATHYAMQVQGLQCAALESHADSKVEHSNLGMESFAFLDDQSMMDGKQVIEDLFRLMKFMLDEWMDTQQER